VSVSQTTSFLTNKVPVAGVTGVVVVAPSFSLTQVAPLPGCVHIRFSHSWSTVVSNPLADPLFLHSSMVTVLPLLLLLLLRAANAVVVVTVPAIPTTNVAAKIAASARVVVLFISPQSLRYHLYI
jgi:hypothetical protein